MHVDRVSKRCIAEVMGSGQTSSCQGTCHRFWDFGIQPGAPPLAVRVTQVSFDEGLCGANVVWHRMGEELAIKAVDHMDSLDPLRWRFERSVSSMELRGKAGNMSTISSAPPTRKRIIRWPDTYRFIVPRRFWQVVIEVYDVDTGVLQEQKCLLEVASCSRDRTNENTSQNAQDAADVATYAHLFNTHILQKGKTSRGEPLPKIRVAMPVGCEVLASAMPHLVAAGDSVTLWPYPFKDVTKYIFEGLEDFCEVPQAFFHFAATTSGGREFICDIQGTCDAHGDIVIVDPCVLRAPRKTISLMLSTLLGSSKRVKNRNPSVPPHAHIDWLEALHPKCGELCSAFAPDRLQSAFRPFCGF